MALSLSAAAKNYQANAIAARFNTGYLRIYSGTKPATADTALSGNTLLAELRFNATAFGAAASGVITANAITADSAADNTGTASFFRCFESDGTTVICDGTCATSGAELNMPTLSIVANAQVAISSLTYTVS